MMEEIQFSRKLGKILFLNTKHNFNNIRKNNRRNNITGRNLVILVDLMEQERKPVLSKQYFNNKTKNQLLIYRKILKVLLKFIMPLR